MKYFFLVFILIFINKNAYSSNLFDTSFYNVEFTSKNIENDKILEIKRIKNESLLSILKKILLEQHYNEINKKITNNLTNTFIKNIIINDEKIINNKYLSNIKINFDKKKIINYLRAKNIPYVEYLPDNFLLIIYEIDGINNNLLTKRNNYYKYINNNFENNKLFIIPNLDINDRFILKPEYINNKEFKKLNNLFNKYKSNENLIIIANRNNNKVIYNMILYSDGNIIEKIIINQKLDIDIFFETLEYETLNLWKEINQIQNISLNYITCKVDYFNMLELKEIRKKLNNILIINNLNIKSLSYKNIEYDINYYGNTKILSKLFNLNQLNFSNHNKSCVIKLK